MMFATDKSTKRPTDFGRLSHLLVLEPPRHTDLPNLLLGPGKYLIGSSSACSVRVAAEGVQPRHAMILVGDQTTLLKALELKTWVNDSVVSDTALRAGDRLSIGPITFLLRYPKPDELLNRSVGPIQSSESTVPATTPGRSHLELSEPDVVATTWEPELKAQRGTIASTAPVESPPPAESPPSVVPLTSSVANAPSTSDGNWIDPQTPEIQQQFAILNEPSTISDPARDSVDTSDERERLAAQQDEMKQLADELSRQSQVLQERSALADDRAAELECKQAQISVENERLITTAQTTRGELAEEYARQASLWQEREAAYRRTEAGLNDQLEAIEQQRATVQVENERLASDRAEIQQLRDEYDCIRRAAAAEQLQVATELGALQTQRAALETEWRLQLVAVQERETQMASERHVLAVAHGELLSFRQQMEHDRTLFTAERSSELLRREQEIREHTTARLRLNEEETSLQTMRLELDAARRAIDDGQMALDREREEFEIDGAIVDDLRVKLSQAETELNLSRQSLQQERADRLAADNEVRRRQADLEEGLPPRNSFDVNDLLSEFSASSKSTAKTPVIPTMPERGSFTNFLPEPSSLPMSSLAPVPPPVPPYDWTASASHDVFSSIGTDPCVSSSHQVLCAQRVMLATDLLPAADSSLLTTTRRACHLGVAADDSRTSAELESSADSRTMIAQSAIPSVAETLTDVNQRFGYAPIAMDHAPIGAESAVRFAENPTHEPPLGTLPSISSPLDEQRPLTTSELIAASPSRDDSLVCLRAQLAQMFDLQRDSPSAESATAERSFVEPSHEPEPPLSASPPVAVVQELDPPEVVEDDEYSVEAQLARLLGRPRGRSMETRDAASPTDVKPVTRTAMEGNSSALTTQPASESVADRSHLSEEPKHKQNKNAVREAVQSFRAVAQISARSALAKHSWNNLRNTVYFTTGLTTASAAATAWYFGTLFFGSETHAWKGITCSLATIASASGLFRSHAQMKSWRRVNSKHTIDDNTPAAPQAAGIKKPLGTDEPLAPPTKA